MPLFTKESLELLRRRVDLVEVLESHLELKRTGPSYKALCPFHDEKTASFTVQRGETHYHCFGCGAHGDAIQFLMQHLKMSFLEAVESLAQRFHVSLEIAEGEVIKGTNRGRLKEVLDSACQFYHFFLLHTPEGHEALSYLYQRGLDLEFITSFEIGLAPKGKDLFRRTMHFLKYSDELLEESGLITKNKQGNWREFFSERITIPVRDSSGSVIGFSARKYKDSTFGGKYINTSETVLFKKSYILFGLSYSRRRIAKERKALIVEGQIDALRLIQEGFNITVASQGTAFGEGHVKELLNLGVNTVYLAFDSDKAGLEASLKTGNLFQKQGVEVFVLSMPPGEDPDSLLRSHGPEDFQKLLEKSLDYLSFLINYHSAQLNFDSPASKTEAVYAIANQIRDWENPLMVHESLRKLSKLMQVPEDVIGVGQERIQQFYIKKTGTLGDNVVDPNRIIEMDLLRWLLLMGEQAPRFVKMAMLNLQPTHFQVTVCRRIYQAYLALAEKNHSLDLLSLAIDLDDAEAQMLISDILQKKVNKEKADEDFINTIQKLLDRSWLQAREEIRAKIHSGRCSDDEVLELAKQFDELKKMPPKVEIVLEPKEL